MTPLADDPMTGEVGRSLKRIEESLTELRSEVRERSHRLNNDLNLMIEPLSALKVRMNAAEGQIGKLDDKVDSVTNRMTFISGGIALAGFLLHWIWPWGH